MDKLKYGKSYPHYFFIFVGLMLFFALFGFGKFISLLTFSLGFLFLSILQLYSGVAFNRAWRADCKKEDHPFQFYLVITLGFIMGTLAFIMAFVNPK